MPAPGDQHRDTAASINPFRDDGPRVTEFTAREIATLQSRLEKQLGPEYISTRPGNGGGKVHYLAAEKVINLANEVFGFNGWSSSIQNVQIDFVDENTQSGRVNLGLSTIVRVTLKDGTYHEDIGYGHCENTKGKAAAFEKAKKEAATDAMKRALRNFGNVLGNCLYDKDYLTKVTKVKVAPSKWDPENLHRHPDFAPMKREPAAEDTSRQNNAHATTLHRNVSVQSARSVGSFGSVDFEDDFGGNFLDETDFSHPDEVRLDDRIHNRQPAAAANSITNGALQPAQQQGVPRTNSMPQMRPPNIQAPTPVQSMQAPQKPQIVPRPPMNAGQVTQNRMLPPQTPGTNQQPPQLTNGGLQPQLQNDARSNPSSGHACEGAPDQQLKPMNGINAQEQQVRPEGVDQDGFPVPRQPPQGLPEGFVTGRKADIYNNPSVSRPPNGNVAFNPHADSPSIRRTQGINPGKSAPVRRTELSGGAASLQSPAHQSPDGIQNAGLNGNPGAQRPTGANFINPSADMNRKIGMPGGSGGFSNNRSGYKPPSAVKRPAMADVTNTHAAEGASDAKKAKLDSAAPVRGETGTSTDQSGVAT